MKRTKELKRLIYAVCLLLLPTTVNAAALAICKEPHYMAYVNQRLNFYKKINEERYQKINAEQKAPFHELAYREKLSYLNQATVLSARFDTESIARRNIEEYERRIIKFPKNDANNLFIQVIRFIIAFTMQKDLFDDALHETEIAKGWLALKNGDEAKAIDFLMASSKVSGSPVLSSFGPDKTLARALYRRGHNEAVLEYLSAIKQFWTTEKAIKMTSLWERMIAVNCPTQFQFYDTNVIKTP